MVMVKHRKDNRMCENDLLLATFVHAALLGACAKGSAPVKNLALN